MLTVNEQEHHSVPFTFHLDQCMQNAVGYFNLQGLC